MLKADSIELSPHVEMFSLINGSAFQSAPDVTKIGLLEKFDTATATINSCLGWRKEGEFHKAINGFTKLIEASELKADILPMLYYERGKTLQARGNTYDKIEAIKDFEKCIELDSTHFAAHVSRADMCQDIGERRAAMKSAEHAIALKPDSCYGYLLRARLNMEHKHPDQKHIGLVISDLEKAIQLGDPDNKDLLPLNWQMFKQVLGDLQSPPVFSESRFEPK